MLYDWKRNLDVFSGRDGLTFTASSHFSSIKTYQRWCLATIYEPSRGIDLPCPARLFNSILNSSFGIIGTVRNRWCKSWRGQDSRMWIFGWLYVWDSDMEGSEGKQVSNWLVAWDERFHGDFRFYIHEVDIPFVDPLDVAWIEETENRIGDENCHTRVFKTVSADFLILYLKIYTIKYIFKKYILHFKKYTLIDCIKKKIQCSGFV